MRLAVLVGTKGRGSNMRAIINACKIGRIDADAALVIAPDANSPAITAARELGIDTAILHPSDAHFGDELLALLAAERIELLCLAGFMNLLPLEVVHVFEGSILNIHPALLPKYGGKGMYGIKVHEAVLASRDSESGCSVHYVTENYDEGKVLLQMKCAVEQGDTPETLAARVLQLEHECYVEAIRLWIRNRNGAILA